MWQKTLRQLARLAYDKQDPSLLTFVLKKEGGSTFEEKYIIKESTELIACIQDNIKKLKTV